MKPTNDKCFIDTNVLVYCYTKDEPAKRKKALMVANKQSAFISTQVLNEFTNTLKKKFNHSWTEIQQTLNEVSADFNVFINKPATIKQACHIADKYKFSFYDSLIIVAALECKCKILYSEDLQHKQLIEKTLTVINPFVL